jgi:hypothetical protein
MTTGSPETAGLLRRDFGLRVGLFVAGGAMKGCCGPGG